MRTFIIILLSSLLLPGCALFSSRTNRGENEPANHPTPSPTVRLADYNLGRVAVVNSKFVVLIFPFGKVPGIGQHLNIYRDEKKVGELKVTGPQRDINTVADIVSGNAEIDDEVRID